MADELGISKQTAYRWIKQNCINESHRSGQTMWYDDAVFNRMKSEFYEEAASNEPHQEAHGTASENSEKMRYDADVIWYREQLESANKQIQELHQLLNQSQQMQGKLMQENTELRALMAASQTAPEATEQVIEENVQEEVIEEQELVQASQEPVNHIVRAEPPQAKRTLLDRVKAAIKEFQKS